MNRKLLTIAFVFACIGQITSAQLKISGEFRSRAIVDHGYLYPVLENTDPEVQFDQRSRLKLDYKSEKYTFRFSLQDARMWGADDLVSKTGSAGNSNALGIYESWVKLNLGTHSSLKAGRQEWNYADMRILSYRDWVTSGQSYDGLLYQLKINKSQLDIGLSYNNNGNRMGTLDNSNWEPDKLKSMNFIHYKQALGPKTNLALTASLSAKVDTSNQNVLETGTHGFDFMHNYGKKGENGFLMRISAYYQHGTDVNRGSDGSYKDISAYLLAFEAGHRSLNKKLELKLGAEYISGRDYTNTDSDYINTRHSFDTQYGALLPYYGGFMNHFVKQDSYKTGTKGGALFVPFMKAKYKLNKKSGLEASVFFPQLASDVKAHTSINPQTQKPAGAETDASGNPVYWKGNMGTYLDLKYAYRVSSDINIKAGLSYAWVSELKNQMVYGYENAANKQLHELGQNYFAWIMLSVNPTVFIQK